MSRDNENHSTGIIMKEVKQAWSSLLSSRISVPSGTSTATANPPATANNGSISGNNNSRATWYDAPIPEIIHGRTFHQEDMDTSDRKLRKPEGVSRNGENSGKELKSSPPKRRLSKDSGIETIASLRRTFLDEFRKSNVVDEHDQIIEPEKQREKDSFPRIESLSRSGMTNDANLNDEVLYQNNVEAALNSLSKICTKELDISAKSSVSRNPVDPDDDSMEQDDERLDHGSNGSIGVERRRRSRRKSSSGSSSRRHSSSVELTARSTVKTDEDGVPRISFSFLRNEESAKPFVRDIPLDDDNEVEMSLEVSEQLVREELYDLPKRGSTKRVVDEDEPEIKAKVGGGHVGSTENEGKAELPPRRLVGCGGNSDVEISQNVELYDFPKNARPDLPAKGPRIITKANVVSEHRIFIKSTGSRCAEDIDNLEDRLYETPMDASDFSCGVSKSSEIDQDIGAEPSAEGSHRARDQNKISCGSLRSGRSVGRIQVLDADRAKDIQAYYSDPECQESSGSIDNLESEEGIKNRKRHQRRLGKAWGKMRNWLREEKSRLGEVVTRHAKLQAVGMHRSGKSENGLSSLTSRTGSYDLTEARTRELGSVTRVEEFGLSSVSEEGNASDSERPDWSMDELNVDGNDGCALEIDHNDDGHGEEKEKHRKRNHLTYSSNDPPDGDLAPARLGHTLSSDNVHRGMGMKLTPVSFSVDKLYSDEVNADATNGIAARRDSERTTATATTTTTSRDHVGKGGLIKRRMLGSIRGLMASTHLLQQQQHQHQHDSEEVAKLDHNSHAIYAIMCVRDFLFTRYHLRIYKYILSP